MSSHHRFCVTSVRTSHGRLQGLTVPTPHHSRKAQGINMHLTQPNPRSSPYQHPSCVISPFYLSYGFVPAQKNHQPLLTCRSSRRHRSKLTTKPNSHTPGLSTANCQSARVLASTRGECLFQPLRRVPKHAKLPSRGPSAWSISALRR